MTRRISDYPLALALAAMSACAGRVDAKDPIGECQAPDPSTCTTEGESPFWGPGPNTYCRSGNDGTEWHLGDVLETRYVLEPGTYHSAKHTLCEVTLDGRVVFEATLQPQVLR